MFSPSLSSSCLLRVLTNSFCFDSLSQRERCDEELSFSSCHTSPSPFFFIPVHITPRRVFGVRISRAAILDVVRSRWFEKREEMKIQRHTRQRLVCIDVTIDVDQFLKKGSRDPCSFRALLIGRTKTSSNTRRRRRKGWKAGKKRI